MFLSKCFNRCSNLFKPGFTPMANNFNEFLTFIFLDLETTGLRRPIEITEICLIAVQKDHLLRAAETKTEPRLIDKLSICVKPVQNIECGASSITGINKMDLAEKREFDRKLAKVIKTFLRRQPSPSCLVAHSGDRFDFDILASEFVNAGVEFPSEIQAADSWKAFRKLHQAEELKTSEAKRTTRTKLAPYTGRLSFSLGNLYKRMTGSEIENSHTAEGDTLALLQLALKKPDVLEYLEMIAHPMGNGGKNPGLLRVKKRTVKRGKGNRGAALNEEEIAQVQHKYFSMLEKEG